MVIIVEGIDNVGKGTQIANIKKYLEENYGPTHYLHYSNINKITRYDRKNPLFANIKKENWDSLGSVDQMKWLSTEYYRQMFRFITYCSDNNINIILDRAHLGETVYGPIYRHYKTSFIWSLEYDYFTDVSDDDFIAGNIDDKTSKLWENTHLFVFTDEAKNVLKRDDGKSLSTDLKQKESEIKAFEEAYNKSRINKYLINVKDKNEKKVWTEEVLPCLESIYKEYGHPEGEPFGELVKKDETIEIETLKKDEPKKRVSKTPVKASPKTKVVEKPKVTNKAVAKTTTKAVSKTATKPATKRGTKK